MKPHVFTATDKSGRRQPEGREAQSIEHSCTMLEREGWRAIEFIDGEDLAASRTRWSPSRQPRTQQEFRIQRSAAVTAISAEHSARLMILLRHR
ncbi:MAG: hypothetical protein H7A12_08920 [Pseudomonadales bacterium]|jgi:hypothetical protein|nr:hypothetical protein [Pseudomonadales bacterium]MCP5320929.1 hypothetical protein [Pseudomonadales bacterium]MCP5338286.1 hypothetical protein [Pseudomonadales bacterium]